MGGWGPPKKMGSGPAHPAHMGFHKGFHDNYYFRRFPAKMGTQYILIDCNRNMGINVGIIMKSLIKSFVKCENHVHGKLLKIITLFDLIYRCGS